MNFDKMELSRFLYPIDEVKASIVTCILKKRSFDETIYWICEYYHSGYYRKSWELLHFVYYSFYSMEYPKIGKRINLLYKKWSDKCKKLEKVFNTGAIIKSNKNNGRDNNELYKNELLELEKHMLNDIIYCYKNIHIRTYSTTVYEIYCYDKYYDKNLENIGGLEKIKCVSTTSKLLKKRYKRKICKKIEDFYGYYMKCNLQNREKETNINFENMENIENTENIISKKDFITICEAIKSRDLIIIVYFMKKYSLYKNIYENTENTVFVIFLSILIEFFQIKVSRNCKQYIECGLIVDWIDMLHSTVFNEYYLLGEIYNLIIKNKILLYGNKKNIEEKEELKETETETETEKNKIKQSGQHIKIVKSHSNISINMEKGNMNKNMNKNNIRLDIVENTINDDIREVREENRDNSHIKILIRRPKNIKSLYLQLNSYYKNIIEYNSTITPIRDILSNYNEYFQVTTGKKIQSYDILKHHYLYKCPNEITTFNILRQQKHNIEFKYIYWYKWQVYCYNTPIWNNRIKYYNGYIDQENSVNTSVDTVCNFDILFDNDDLLELFNDIYNYEPDEQPRYIQDYVISDIDKLPNIFNISINCQII